MTEWFKVTVLKTVEPKGSVSSNLTLSANNKSERKLRFFVGTARQGCLAAGKDLGRQGEEGYGEAGKLAWVRPSVLICLFV